MDDTVFSSSICLTPSSNSSDIVSELETSSPIPRYFRRHGRKRWCHSQCRCHESKSRDAGDEYEHIAGIKCGKNSKAKYRDLNSRHSQVRDPDGSELVSAQSPSFWPGGLDKNDTDDSDEKEEVKKLHYLCSREFSNGDGGSYRAHYSQEHLSKPLLQQRDYRGGEAVKYYEDRNMFSTDQQPHNPLRSHYSCDSSSEYHLRREVRDKINDVAAEYGFDHSYHRDREDWDEDLEDSYGTNTTKRRVNYCDEEICSGRIARRMSNSVEENAHRQRRSSSRMMGSNLFLLTCAGIIATTAAYVIKDKRKSRQRHNHILHPRTTTDFERTGHWRRSWSDSSSSEDNFGRGEGKWRKEATGNKESKGKNKEKGKRI